MEHQEEIALRGGNNTTNANGPSSGNGTGSSESDNSNGENGTYYDQCGDDDGSGDDGDNSDYSSDDIWPVTLTHMNKICSLLQSFP